VKAEARHGAHGGQDLPMNATFVTHCPEPLSTDVQFSVGAAQFREFRVPAVQFGGSIQIPGKIVLI